MINVQPFLDRLEEAKEYMDFYIEVLYSATFYKGIHIIKERKDFKCPYKIEPIPMSDPDGNIEKHMALMKQVKADLDNWINGHIGIPTDRMGKPYPRTDREIAIQYSLMAAEKIKTKR